MRVSYIPAMDDFDEVEHLFYALALALSFFFVFIAMKTTPAPAPVLPSGAPSAAAAAPPPPQSPDVLNDLISNGATFYGASWCGFTKKQLAELGITETKTKGLDYVDCETQEELCFEKGIEAFPTWQINGQMYPGYYPPAKLAELLTKS